MEAAVRECLVEGRPVVFIKTLEADFMRANYYWRVALENIANSSGFKEILHSLKSIGR